MKKLLIVFLVCISFTYSFSYAQTCKNIPTDHVYYLTAFCDKVTACGITCGNCTWNYAADSQRFGCKSTINCVRKTKAANLLVIDQGPSCALQKKAGKPIIDASLSACYYFTGEHSCGYEDKFDITCKKVASPLYNKKLPLGPCTWDLQNKQLPYCHLQQTKQKFNFQNIQDWVKSRQFEEIILKN